MKKRSVKISGHLTSVSLEEEFWRELKTLAKAEKLSLNALIEKSIRDVAEISQAPSGFTF
jgi:predicted DNA-binding ribbon-helix-helix protein